MRKLPQASNPIVARLRLRRRAQPRMPSPIKLNCPPACVPASRFKKVEAKANPEIKSSAPAPKKIPALPVSFCEIAQTIKPIAPIPQMAPIHFDQFLELAADDCLSAISNSA